MQTASATAIPRAPAASRKTRLSDEEIRRFHEDGLVIPDYRKVPDVHFPAFLDDGAEAVAWVAS